jgi:hypothetical protein
MSWHRLCPYCGQTVDLDMDPVEVRVVVAGSAASELRAQGREVVRPVFYHPPCAIRAGFTVPSIWDTKEGLDYE